MCKFASGLSKKATSPNIVSTDEEIKFISDKLGTSYVHELLTHLHSWYWQAKVYLLSHPLLSTQTILSLNICLSTNHCRQEPNCKLHFLWPSQHFIVLQNGQYPCQYISSNYYVNLKGKKKMWSTVEEIQHEYYYAIRINIFLMWSTITQCKDYDSPTHIM